MYMGGKREFGCYVVLVMFSLIGLSSGNFVFNVEHKFGGKNGVKRTLSAVRDHDQRRHGRSLAVDVPLGGSPYSEGGGLYFAKISLGTPPKDYYLQVDTGSDFMWISCDGCKTCPKKSSYNVTLSLYHPKDSKTARGLKCEDPFVGSVVKHSRCKDGEPLPFNISYMDGDSCSGNVFSDTIQLNKATGDNKTTPADGGSVVFGCATKLVGAMTEDGSVVDGLIGMGRSNYSVTSQLASAGKVKGIFSHCLDSMVGGIFTIGELAQPIKAIPFFPSPYNSQYIIKIGVDMGQKPFDIPINIGGEVSTRVAMIDSGTSQAMFDQDLYNLITDKILAAQPNLTTRIIKDMICFHFSKNISDSFPSITLRFENSLTLTADADHYLVQDENINWCIALGKHPNYEENSTAKTPQLNVVGDIFLSNKIVVYDLENKTVGWADHNCSLGVKLKDEQSKDQYLISYHNLSAPSAASHLAFTLPMHWTFTLFLSLLIVLIYI